MNLEWFLKPRKENGGNGNLRKNRNHPNLGIVKISQITKKSFGDLTRFAVTQTPVKDHLLTLVRKTRKITGSDLLIMLKTPTLARSPKISNDELGLLLRWVTI